MPVVFTEACPSYRYPSNDFNMQVLADALMAVRSLAQWDVQSPSFSPVLPEIILILGFGAAYGTAKSGVGLCAMGVMRPELMMKNIIPIVMVCVI